MAYLASLAVVIFFAGNILVGSALTELGPVTVALIRLVVALAILLPLGARSAYHHRRVFLRHWKPLLIATLAGVTFFNTFIYSALQFTSAANVAVLESIIPTATILASVALLKERLVPVQWIGVALSFAGALWVVTNGQILALTDGGWNPGDAIMVAAIIGWVIYTLQIKKYIHLFGARALLLVMTAISVPILLPVAGAEWLLLGAPTLGEPELWAGLIYLGVFPSVVAILCYNYAVLRIGAAQASLFLNFLPVFTIAGSYVFLGDEVSRAQILGALVVICGVVLATYTGSRRPAAG